MADLTIIDGHNYLFRAFYGVPEAAQTKSGVQVNAVYGFFANLRQIASAYPNNEIFVVFDSETGIQDKLGVMGDYKAGREINTDMFKQLPYIKQILDLMNIKWLEHPNYEADDIIASIATHWSVDGNSVYISSNDFDFTQLVSDSIHLIRSVQGKLVNCDNGFIKAKFGILPRQYVDYLSIVGDKTDKITGVNGLGQKTVSDLLCKYYDIAGIFDSLQDLSNKVKSKISDNKERIESNKKFISMNKNIPRKEVMLDGLPAIKKDLIQQKIAIHLKNIGL